MPMLFNSHTPVAFFCITTCNLSEYDILYKYMDKKQNKTQINNTKISDEAINAQAENVEVQEANVVETKTDENVVDLTLDNKDEVKETSVAIADNGYSGKLILVGEKKEKSKTNKFDRFWIKIWSGIVAFISTIGGWIQALILLIFRKSPPKKYCNAFVAVVMLAIILAILISPFSINSSNHEQFNVYNDGLVPVLINKGHKANEDEYIYLWGFANKKGKLVIDAKYSEVKSFRHGVAFVKLSQDNDGYLSTNWILINKKGKQKGDISIPDQQFCPVGQFSSDPNLAWVYQAGVYKYIKTNGKFAFDGAYDEAGDFINGVARVKQGSNIYFINSKGKQITEWTYDDARDMCEGLAAVKSGAKWGFINNKGKEVITRGWDAVSDFHGGYAMVKRGTTMGVIDTKGREVVDPSKNFAELQLDFDFWNGIIID